MESTLPVWGDGRIPLLRFFEGRKHPFNPTARLWFYQLFESECKQACASCPMETLTSQEVQEIIIRGLCEIRVNAFFYGQLEVENHTLEHWSFHIKKSRKEYLLQIWNKLLLAACFGVSALTHFSQFSNHKLINKLITGSNKCVRARNKTLY